MFKLLLAPEAQRCARAPLAVFIPHLFCVAPVSESSVSSLSVPFSHSLREYTTAALCLSFLFHPPLLLFMSLGCMSVDCTPCACLPVGLLPCTLLRYIKSSRPVVAMPGINGFQRLCWPSIPSIAAARWFCPNKNVYMRIYSI